MPHSDKMFLALVTNVTREAAASFSSVTSDDQLDQNLYVLAYAFERWGWKEYERNSSDPIDTRISEAWSEFANHDGPNAWFLLRVLREFRPELNAIRVRLGLSAWDDDL